MDLQGVGSGVTFQIVINIYIIMESIPTHTKCGVPKGCVLGPLFFIICTNDLPSCLNLAKTIVFADDNSIYLSSNDHDFMYRINNDELDRLTDWFQTIKLSLNATKTANTNYMLFYNSGHTKS